MNYTDILGRAWRITWRHKVLWIFGILAGCGQGGGGGNSNFRFQRSLDRVIPGGGPGDFPGMERFQQFMERPEFQYIVIGLALLGLIIALVIFVLSIIGRGSLIAGANLAEVKGAVTFGEAWAVGLRSFWRLLGIGLLVLLPILVAALLGGAITLLTFGLGLVCLVPLLCLLALAMIPVVIVAHFAQFYVVLEDARAIDAFRKGWELLKSNLGPILILGVILIVTSFIAGLVLALPLLALVAPVFAAWVLNEGALADVPMPLLVGAGLGFVCYLPILIVLTGILQTWVMSAWTLAFRQWTAGSAAAPGPLAAPPAAA